MKWFVLLLLLCPSTWAASPLLVASVERPGLPPYEGTERVYRLEGPGCQTLRVGEILVLQRQGERRSLGRLEILSAHLGHAQARLSAPGDTFPIKGDMAVRTELFRPLPEMPIPALYPGPALDTLRPCTITRTLPQSMGQAVVFREPIYFLKGDASLSPGAQAKLGSWAGTWGAEGQWSLEVPQGQGSLSTLRIAALRSELERWGIPTLAILPLPEEPSGQYDAIYVKKEPW